MMGWLVLLLRGSVLASTGLAVHYPGSFGELRERRPFLINDFTAVQLIDPAVFLDGSIRWIVFVGIVCI